MGTERDRQIGEAVARIRQSREMTQQAVADGMRARSSEHKWSQATVWGVERGDRALKVSELNDLARVLRTGTHYITNPTDASAQMRELIEEYKPLERWAKQLDELLEKWDETLDRLKVKWNGAIISTSRGQFDGDDNLPRLKAEIQYAGEVVAASEEFIAQLRAAIGDGGNAAVRNRVLLLDQNHG